MHTAMQVSGHGEKCRRAALHPLTMHFRLFEHVCLNTLQKTGFSSQSMFYTRRQVLSEVMSIILVMSEFARSRPAIHRRRVGLVVADPDQVGRPVIIIRFSAEVSWLHRTPSNVLVWEGQSQWSSFMDIGSHQRIRVASRQYRIAAQWRVSS